MRVAIVGGGVIGLLCVHHLVRRGAHVIVVERHRIGAGCSAGNAGWVTPSLAVPLPAPGLRWKSLRWMLRRDSPLYIRPRAALAMAPWLLGFWRCCNRPQFERGVAAMARLGADTFDLYDQLAADGVEYECHRTGLLMAFRSRQEMREEREMLELVGYTDLEPLSAAEVGDREPTLDRGVAAGIRVRPERTVRPEHLCSGVAKGLLEAGSEIVERTTVEGVCLEGRSARALRTAIGEIDADAVLIATGAEAGRLAASCGLRLPLQAGKGYSVTVSGPRVRPLQPLYLSDSKVGVTPFDDGVRIAGTMELSGINLELDRVRLAALKRGAERDVPRVTEGRESVDWVGMRPLTPDGLPILGRLPERDNLFVATGHQMLGVTLAPSTGRVMAELILDGRGETELEPFSPARFAR